MPGWRGAIGMISISGIDIGVAMVMESRNRRLRRLRKGYYFLPGYRTRPLQSFSVASEVQKPGKIDRMIDMVKSFNWAKDEVAGPVLVIEMESGIKVCCPAQQVLTYFQKEE